MNKYKSAQSKAEESPREKDEEKKVEKKKEPPVARNRAILFSTSQYFQN